MSISEESMTVTDAHKALDDVLREERGVLIQAQEQVNAINSRREEAMQYLRQALANEPPPKAPADAPQSTPPEQEGDKAVN